MMKSLVIVLFTVLSVNLKAGESEKIANLIQTANTAELVNMFNSSIELVTPNTSGVHSRDQAKMILDNFFRNNQPVKAVVAHETTGTTNSMLVINLTTKTGSYRISISGTYKGSNFIINEFKIL